MSGDQVTEAGLLLDPFGWHVDVASRIGGLGGTKPSFDPTYVFHTPYVRAERGSAAFEIMFENLTAKRGTLLIRLHMLPDEPGAIARLVDSERIQLNRLVKDGGRVHMAFEAFAGVTYALMGQIADNTDARAHSMAVRLDRPDSGRENPRIRQADGRSTRFSSNDVVAAAHILSVDPPTLTAPVSQPFTRAQMADPGLLEPFHDHHSSNEHRAWEQAYLLRVFKRYGALGEGARALCVGVPADLLDDALRQAGTQVQHVMPDGLVPKEEPDNGREIPSRIVDLNALPPDLADFDFLWSSGLHTLLMDPPLLRRRLVAAMDVLRPGGLAVHMLRVDARVAGERHEGEEPGAIGRGDVEQLALTMISHGHEVARIRSCDPAYLRAPAPFGLITRKARAVL